MKTILNGVGWSAPLEGNEDLIQEAVSITQTQTLNSKDIFLGADFYKDSGSIVIFNKTTDSVIYNEDFSCEKKFNDRIKYFQDLGVKTLKEQNNEKTINNKNISRH
jgi:hypothetical protein